MLVEVEKKLAGFWWGLPASVRRANVYAVMQPRAPRIGITCDFTTTTDKRGSALPQYVLHEAYVAAITRAGGEPWLLPHLDPESAPSVVAMLDGLLLSGGDFDVPASFYDEEPRHVRNLCEARSNFERALVLAAWQADLPLLGVCGGMQLLNVIFGGTLYQDLSERRGCLSHEQAMARHLPSHSINIRPGSLLARLTNTVKLEVNSTHHQLIKKLGTGVEACAAAPDGVVEAIELDTKRFMLGVQWHPEAFARELAHQSIYHGLVQSARTAHSAR